jgi:ectoine hydroxylase-related dioxygenase (phytanoyl-CoA dioxygenase family)
MTEGSPTLLDDAFHYGQEEQAHYETEGYTIFENFLRAEGLAACQENLDRMIAATPADRDPAEMISTHQLGESWVWALATEPKLLDLVERHIGPDIVLWSSHCLCKRPHTGEAIPWHQDALYWNVSGKLAPGIWIPFDDIDEENGAMSVLPRWHNKGELKRNVGDQDLFNQEIDPMVLPDNVDDIRVAYNLRAGQLAIHDTMIPHNSVPNRSDRWRRVLVLRYIDAAGDVGDKQYTDYRTGETFERECYLVRGEDVTGRGLKRSPY